MPAFFLPSLLDRLVDNAPGKARQDQMDRGLVLDDYRAMVERDLLSLLEVSPLPQVLDSSSSHSALVQGLGSIHDFPLVEESVFNYGLRNVGGFEAEHELIDELAARIQRVIECYEPRVLNVLVKPIKTDDLKGDPEKKVIRQKLQAGVFSFAIEGELYAEPLPEYFRVKTEFDLKTGCYSVAL